MTTLITAATGLDLRPHFAALARRPLPDGDLRTVALTLNAGAGLVVRTPHDLPVTLPGLTFVPDPVDEDEDVEADVSLVIHRADPVATAAEVEARMLDGQRVALVDQRYAGHGDPDLIKALLASTVYVGNLAAYDIDTDRALLTVMTPLRDGQAFRLLIGYSVVYWWAWRGIVAHEIARRFGPTIAPDQIARARNHARSRVGAYLLALHRRGLRYFIGSVDFPAGTVDSFTFTLIPAK